MTTPPATDHSRAEARRQQILAAAAQCFREHGFHGASISQISRIAGMSAGHIYHYFENKEAIIAAIVEQDLESLLQMTGELRAACDVRQALIARAAKGVAEQLDPQTAGLKLEIVAEASRNPRVAEIVRNADAASRQSLGETIRIVRQRAGHQDDEASIAGMIEVLATLFEGLLLRTLRHPQLDHAQLTLQVQAAIESVLSQPS
ncbi:MAG TPA: TetR/AcrR family transcriptional regulator [Thauera sp.]|nr:TetR/AcrR family transcriptional regulator [Thauera sp.]HRA81033.1 TetR/AcrR family transcriptional regulator [Thauera sp.]